MVIHVKYHGNGIQLMQSRRDSALHFHIVIVKVLLETACLLLAILDDMFEEHATRMAVTDMVMKGIIIDTNNITGLFD